MHPYTEIQTKSFIRGKWLLETYKMISTDPEANQAVIVGKMIADLFYIMTLCYEYPVADIESAKKEAFNSIEHDQEVYDKL